MRQRKNGARETQSRIERQVATSVAEGALWSVGATVVAAVSGGADSLCLLGTLLALRENAPEVAPAQIVVAHLDHGLRGEAGEADARFVEQLCATLGLRFVRARSDVAALARRRHVSLETAARQARYDFLRRVAKNVGATNVGATRIATGHTRDDQAETLILHWLRGSGLAGLTGMRPLSGDIVRPLLALTRDDTEAYCAARGWSPREDASNEDRRFTRNRIHHDLLPRLEAYNPNLRESLVRNATLLADDERYLSARADAAWDKVVRSAVGASAGRIEFELCALSAQPPALRHRLLRRAAHLAAIDAPPGQTSTHAQYGEHYLEARHLLLLDRLLASGRTGDALDLPGSVTARLDYGTLRFARRPPAARTATVTRSDEEVHPLPVPGEVTLPEMGYRIRAWFSDQLPGLESRYGPGSASSQAKLPALERVGNNADVGRAERRAYLDADAVGIDSGETLSVRAWRPGDRFRPLGMSSEKKLQDFFADAKVPRELRRRLPLIFGPRHLLWVAGQRIDDRVQLTPTTQRFLVLEIEALSPCELAAPPQASSG